MAAGETGDVTHEPGAELRHTLHQGLALTALICGVPVLLILWGLEASSADPRVPMLGVYAVMALVCLWAGYRIVSGKSLEGALKITIAFNALFVLFQAYYGVVGGQVSLNMFLMLITNAVFRYLVFGTRSAGLLNLGMFGAALALVLLRAVQGDLKLSFFDLQLFLSTGTVLMLLHALAWYKNSFIALAQKQLRLEHEAWTDALTGLPNRRRLYQQLELLLDPAHPDAAFPDMTVPGKRTVPGQGGSVIMLDIDHFKLVNDTHGHLAGDSALTHIAGLLRQEAQDGETPGRWGGEEFMLILPGATGAGATCRAEALRQRLLASPHPQVGLLTASFGVSACHAGDDLTRLVARVDNALYGAKAAGRDRIHTAEAETASPDFDGDTATMAARVV
ncbi:GGDEF domain-containing protein [Deinococcus sp. AJ005]|uniref:GGDEF domain-containing protein n=1 Tax=Deinococcus sp. AJ005 TaxID=2652443 RepID=UPI0018657D7C|nr:GGDEF domain-containing protein [Deinococcus sp. AJ005]